MDVTILEREMREFKKVIQELESKILAYDIDRQNYVKRENVIKPDSGCKVFYDKNGLVLRAEPLTVQDIPTIPIEKVEHLQASLNDAVSEHLKIKERTKITPGEGFKISYNEYGDVVSSIGHLNPSDIPILPTSKIETLDDRLNTLSNTLKELQEENDNSSPHIAPTIATKVQVDGNGRVIRGMSLSLTDLPNELMIKLNRLENMLYCIPEMNNMKRNISSLDERILQVQKDVEELPRTVTPAPSNDKKVEDLKKELMSMKDSLDDKANVKQFIGMKNDFQSLLVKAKSAEKILVGLDGRINEINRHIAILNNKMSNMENTIHNLVSVINVESSINELREEIKNIQEKIK